MIRTILAAHDGSAAADAGLRFAATVAQLSEAPVVVVRIVETMQPFFDPRRGEVVWLSEDEPRLEVTAGDLLAEQLAMLRRFGIEGRAVIRLGRAAEGLIGEATEWPEPVLVLASHGRGGLGRAVLGSVTDRVLRSAPCPVAVVRSAGPVPDRIGHLLVPLDGSPRAERALPYAVWLAERAKAQVTLARVAETHRELLAAWRGKPVAREAREAMAHLESEARAYLERTRRHLPEGLEIRLESPSGDPKRQLVHLVEQLRPDLVVLTTHGQSGPVRWLLGSVTERLLTTTRVPLLVVPSYDGEG